ncbi:PLP-dependent aminotransferase family protein [Alkalicoccus daliensis]|uniref:GntR family transcriptional regulator / MocR family aminotransferase n=1 Tax=Alkalicoccus daliensis TaxID=745820 RepID=A0A1G9ZG28_9BACI|nr:PLP-dependent aminotransferase family protein [Alkalicoccus daliensis]SDN19423.1 GntR family transcriptional regulator / MocR family aminotransferase [Alkalicoccus daliensis]
MDISILLNKKLDSTLYMQIYYHLRQEIKTGRIKPKEKLPSKRKLADQLGVSQHTVETAYQQLKAEGYVESRPRSGIYAAVLPEDEWLLPALPVEEESLISSGRNKIEIDFSHGKVDLRSFPLHLWKKLSNETLQQTSEELFLNGDPKGELNLREEIKKHLYQSRGVECTASQIIIGAGTQYLMHLLVMLLGRNKNFGMENPGFHRTRGVFEREEVSWKPIALDKEGIMISELAEKQIEAVYITPSHQFPLGHIMPVKRRIELLQWALQNNSFIIEDDYDGEYRYAGQSIPALQGLYRGREQVIYLGTFSKTLLPSLRISYMVLPEVLVKKFDEQLLLYKQTVSRLHQHTLYLFMKRGHWQTHVNKMRTNYRRKQEQLLLSIEEHFGERVKVKGEKSGLHILLQLKTKEGERKLIELAEKQGVKVYPVSIYYADRNARYSEVLLGFGGLSKQEIEEGIIRLKAAWYE